MDCVQPAAAFPVGQPAAGDWVDFRSGPLFLVGAIRASWMLALLSADSEGKPYPAGKQD
jgi:hypothetical protein